ARGRPPRGARALRQGAARSPRRHPRRAAPGAASQVRQVSRSETRIMKSVSFGVRPWLLRSVVVCVGLGLTFLSVAAAARPHFDSKGPDKAITVDGKFDDWYAHLQPFGAAPVAIQLLNDR